ncbi:hypothetical protein LIER_32774 [Lithospermum erythrorhizon]|uniref:Retrotransposon gag domain-containing protein n=1 Tax=Lithospermum erythrorhizon TaxID=34254 RepID=A0AAV3S0M6_LITER
MPTTTSKKECKTNMPFTDRLDAGFLAKMTITSNNLDIYAKAFSNNLSDKALDWYMALLLKSIDTYQQTEDAFIAKFGSSIQAHQDERALMDIEQGPNESLKNYHKRYNDILLNIHEVNNKVAYMAFYRGLRYGKLKKALVLETSLSKDQLTKRVKQYVELEELKSKESKDNDLRDVIACKRMRSKLPKKTPVWERIQRDRGQTFKKRQFDPQPQKGLVRCTQTASLGYLTPLRVLIAEIFSQIYYKNLLPKLVRMRSAPGRRDKNPYCKYHREHSHGTNECRILKAEIEKLIKRGYLKEFIEKGDRQDFQHQNHQSPQMDNSLRIKMKRKKHLQ